MTAFEYLSVALSFVVGLGVTYLLTSLLSLFRERRICRPDWLPLLWAFFIAAYQIQFWWATYELVAMETWRLPVFLSLLLYSLLLFGAGGLILPHDASKYPEGLRAYFEKDGRAGVVLLSVYMLTAPIVNATLFNTSLLDPVNIVVVGLGLFGASIVFLEDRRAHVVHALIWGGIGAWVFSSASTAAY